MERSKAEVVVPEELVSALESCGEAKAFFDGLSDGYKRGYCGGAKQAATRVVRAEKALAMLQNKQKTLKTV